MTRWSRYILQLTAASVVLTGNCFVCAVIAPPALAAEHRPGVTMTQCEHEGRLNAAGATAHADPGPYFYAPGPHAADRCPMSGHNETPSATERSESFLTAAFYGSTVITPASDVPRINFSPSFSANIFVRAGPVFIARNLVGTTIKKE